MFEDIDNKKKQEEIQEKKTDEKDIKKEFKPGNIPPQENLNLNKNVDLSSVSTLPSPVDKGKGKEFEKRMQGLHDKGKRRGLKFSIIGLFFGIIITVGTIYLINSFKGDVQDMSNEVKRQSDEPIEAVIDIDSVCNNDYCCLASLRRINNNNYFKIKESEDCPEGYTENALSCINSLFWCEPSVAIIQEDIILEKEDLEEVVDINMIASTTEQEIQKNIPDTASYTVEHAMQEENKDSDNDGLSDVEEIEYGTDINNPDTDGDGFLDGAEVKNGYNPLK